MKNPKFQLFTGNDGDTYFRLRAGNGQPILASEGYESMASARNGIASVRENAMLDMRFQRRTSANSQPFFVLIAANGEPIGRSEMYASTAGMENGIAAVKKVAPTAPVEDATE